MKHTTEQQQIIETIKEGKTHLIINAVAGAGKTTTILEGLKEVPAHQTVLFCAFNVSIRNEISKRVRSYKNSLLDVKNIHQLGLELMKSNSLNKIKIDNFKYSRLFQEFISSEGSSFFSRFLNLCPKNAKVILNNKEAFHFFRKIALDGINKVRLNLVKKDPSAFTRLNTHYNIVDSGLFKENATDLIDLFFVLIFTLIEKGNNTYFEKGTIDFTDMLYLPMVLNYRPLTTYDRIFIDECQDLSRAQLGIVLKYTDQSTKVVVVGDPHQSIYGFTGADSDSFSNFYTILENPMTLPLSVSFRCPEVVTKLAANFRKDIISGTTVTGCVKTIEEDELYENIMPGDMILCRWKDSLIVTAFKLLTSNKPIYIDVEEINDMIKQLTAIFSDKDLNTPCGDWLLSANFYQEVKNKNIKIFTSTLSTKLSYEAKSLEISNFNYLMDSKLQFIKFLYKNYGDSSLSLSQLCNKSSKLISNSGQRIWLSTIHKAKGLEAHNVFILKYNEMPLKYPGQKSWELEQELNLQYVAITRTKKQLFLVEEYKKQKNSSNLSSSINDTFFSF